jgi:diaminopimelate dehydrogenase
VYRLAQAGQTGCKTVLDVPPAMLSALDGETLRRTLL